jgi:phosphoribosylformylglycinamidine synthase
LSFAAGESTRLDALLFGEAQSRVIISVAPHDAVKVVERAKILGLSAAKIGVVGGGELTIKAGAWEGKWPLAELHDLWWNAIARAMDL